MGRFPGHDELRGTRRIARNPTWRGEAQKRRSQPRMVGLEFCWTKPESNHRHKDFQSTTEGEMRATPTSHSLLVP